MKKYILFSIAFIGSILMGCSDDNSEPTKDNNLVIKTGIPELPELAAARAVKATFNANDEMGIYVKSGSDLTSAWYKGVTGVVKATYDGSAWTLTPNVVLSSDVAQIFAYYPFSSSVNNPEAIPVKTASQIDYLYSGGNNKASGSNNTLILQMNHVQANFRFNVINMDYMGEGILKSITIRNKENKTAFRTEGTFNAATGMITPEEGADGPYAISGISKKIESGKGWQSALPSAMVIPFGIQSKGDVEFVFEIDDNSYTVECPVQNDGYAKGQQYTFNLKLSGKNLVLNKEDITIEPWGENSVDLDDVVTRGRSITYTVTTEKPNQPIYIPEINLMSDVAVSFGDGQTAPYSSGLRHTYAAAGKYQIIIASENVIDQVEFADVMSVSEIDFSGLD